ncbi:type I polyketide synthase, partial [Burkholderia sp. Ac-20379]|uniref:type I polyketide synthase n=1 Tax=Burkholderia sp. Ac-20379 TaxID=2703900 RepID=UPI00197D481A
GFEAGQAAAIDAPAAEAGSSAGAPEPIAIVGLSCRFPQAADADAFWQNLLDGRDCIDEIPADRWNWRELDGDPKREPNRTNIRWGGFIDGIFEFDPLFFGISPLEAQGLDPQQRLLLQHVWQALEDAGHAPRAFAGRPVGLFVATSASGYREAAGEQGANSYTATGSVPSVGPNRVSYLLDWHGPSEPVETACSSSLVAIHRALQAMRAGDCEMAVVGGVNTILTPDAHVNFAKAGMLSPDGRCKTFSADANGYVRGEGVAVLVLRRLADAERDGDAIYGVIRGSAINHGGRANSLTAPNTAAQTELLRRAYDAAGVDPATVGYIETHGTGTALGDPVEINALKAAFRDTSAAAGANCGLGSVKSNIGHLELAAGMAGIVKVLLQMRHRTLVASLHSTPQNPYVELDGSPFHIVRENRHWAAPLDRSGQALPRRAGVSSFGFGGVNAHVIVEEHAGRAPRSAADLPAGPRLVVLSARDPQRLREQAWRLAQAIGQGRVQPAELGDLAYTLAVGREAMRCRLALEVESLDALRLRLLDFLDGRGAPVETGELAPGRLAGREAEAGLDATASAARRWVRGLADAADLLPRGPWRRIHLPTYAFARDVYRHAAPGAATPADARPFDPERIVLDPAAFYLRDHRVNGQRVLPGAMTLELARAAYASRQPQATAACSLHGVVWSRG